MGEGVGGNGGLGNPEGQLHEVGVPLLRLATVRFGSCSGVLGPNLNLHIEVQFE